MATKIGDLFFDVYADISRAVKDIDGVGKAAVSAGSAAAKAIGQTIANAVGIATGATALLVATTLNAGAAYNTLGQSATAAFSSIYGDVSAAHSILSEISELDLETPFTGKSLTSTARTLAGFGFQLKDVVDTTEALAQATAAMGLGSDALHRMAIAFGQIQSRGKLAGDEARQLANYGIDAYGLLADQLGLTVAAVRELGQEGKLTADFVIPALVQSIESRFAGATEALFNTAAGQAEGLRSIMEGVGSALVEPFIGFAGGGALVEAMGLIREELVQLVGVAEDGSFRLQGFLAPLQGVAETVAEGVRAAGEGIANFLGGLDGSALYRLGPELEGLGPLIAAVGAGLATIFAQAIPLVGRFVAGFNPIVVAISALILTSSELRQEFGDAFREIVTIIEPLIPKVQELLRNIMDLAEDAGPAIADILVNAFKAVKPVLEDLLDIANDLIPVLGPVLVEVLEEVAAALDALAMILENGGSGVAIFAAALYGLSVLLPTVTAAIVIETSAVGMLGGAYALLATNVGMVVTALGIAAAAYGSYQAISAGVKGDLDYLNRDVSIIEKPFQLAGRLGFALGGGDREQVAQTAEMNRLLQEGEEMGVAYARSLANSGLSMAEFSEQARAAGLTVEGVSFATIEYRDILDEQIQAQIEAGRAIGATTAANMFEARVQRDLGGATEETTETIEEQVDILAALKVAANDAWEEVDRLSRAGADAVVDDFLVGLKDTAKDLTEALAEPAGALRDLDVGSALNQVQADALKVINVLSREYGMSFAEIRSYLDERGLAGVIEELGKVTEETTETVDPLVAKYASLGATADQLRDAISRLEDERTTALQAQIDQVEAHLRDAKDAAEEARAAVADFLSGGYIDSTQELIDNLIGDIGSIGSRIEDALKMGGVRGDAAVRSALGDLQGQLAAIVNQGMEEGLSGQQIVDMLAPVLSAINEEVGDAANRISSLDWTEGISSASGRAIVDALMSGMDPGAIQSLINDILGADASVAGLENQLENLQADMRADVEFSAEQVQGALDAIHAETTVTAVITPEAAQLVFDAIQDVFEDDDLRASVDQAVITQEILDAAQEAEDSISLVFKSALSFDSAELDAVARQVSEEFYAAFQDQLMQLRDQIAQERGFDSYSDMVRALGPAVAAATVGGAAPSLSQVINNDITVNESSGPMATATEIVAASSAAAGSGGQYDPSKYFGGGGFGTTVIPGYRGPQ